MCTQNQRGCNKLNSAACVCGVQGWLLLWPVLWLLLNHIRDFFGSSNTLPLSARDEAEGLLLARHSSLLLLELPFVPSSVTPS